MNDLTTAGPAGTPCFPVRGLHLAARGLAIGALTLLLAGCAFGREPAPTPVLLPTPTVAVGATYTVSRGPVVSTAEFGGKVVLGVEEELFFSRSGRVAALYVESGQTVAPDQIIAELETRDLDYDVADARLAVALAQQRLDEAERQLAFAQRAADLDLAIASRQLESLRAQVQVDPTAITVQELRVQQAQLTVDQLALGVDPQLQTDLTRAQLALERAQATLADAQIVAPFGGEVRLLEGLQEGRGVEAYAPLATLVDPASLQIEANLLPADLETLQEGMAVAIRPANRPGVTLSGTISRLPQPFGTGVDATTRVALDDPAQSGLRAGASVALVAELARVEDALWVPPAVLHSGPEGTFVLVRAGDAVQKVVVQVGVRNHERVEIRQGLREGQVVVGS